MRTSIGICRGLTNFCVLLMLGGDLVVRCVIVSSAPYHYGRLLFSSFFITFSTLFRRNHLHKRKIHAIIVKTLSEMVTNENELQKAMEATDR